MLTERHKSRRPGHLAMEQLEDRRLLARDVVFAVPEYYPTDGNPEGMTTADLNDDGHVDLIVNTSPGVRVLLGRGDGTLDAAVRAPFTGQTELGLGTADFDGELRGRS